MDTWTNRLIAAGHATRAPFEGVVPVTTDGTYRGANGFHYQVAWRAGRANAVSLGYSLAYWEADRAAVASIGEWGFYDHDEKLEARISQALGL